MRRRKKIKLGEIAEWGNLELALSKALRGKRQRQDAQRFLADMPVSLANLGAGIRQGRAVTGEFREFTIHDPKRRLICAPCFRDRVTHHAVMNLCEDVFERWQIEDSYACRRGKGLHAAVARAAGFSRRYRYFLKADVRHYFETLPREELWQQVCCHFPGEDMHHLWKQLIWSWRPGRERGLPIGSLTSQHLGNFYLASLDRLVKQDWRLKGYVRYMDDFVLWSDDKAELIDRGRLLNEYTRGILHQLLKPLIIQPSRTSLQFLGTRIRAGRVGLNARSRRRYAKRIRQITRDLISGELCELDAQQQLSALTAFTGIAACQRFRRKVVSGA